MQLQHVAREMLQLVERYVQYFSSAVPDGAKHSVPVLGLYGFSADDAVGGAETHQHIGVVNIYVVAVVGLEKYGRVTHLFAEIREYLLRCPVGFAGVNNSVIPVKNHASCSFEEEIVIFPPCQVDETAHLEILSHCFQYFRLALVPPVDSGHRVKDEGAVLVGAEPVVGENGVGSVRMGSVLRDDYVYLIGPEQGNVRGELAQSVLLG